MVTCLSVDGTVEAFSLEEFKQPLPDLNEALNGHLRDQ